MLNQGGSTNAQDRIDSGAGHRGRRARGHGLDGIARLPEAPNLAGESTLYLERQLKAFRAGERKSPQMSVVAQALSDADIANLAAWYSSIEITAKMPK